MEIATLVSALDQPHLAAEQFERWGLRDGHRAREKLLELAESGLSLDLLAALCEQLGRHLPRMADPDAALSEFARYLFAARSPLALAALLERDAAALPMLLEALSLGPRWAEYLIDDPEAFDLLRQTAGQPLSRDEVRGQILGECLLATEESLVSTAILRWKSRHELRIAYAESVLGQRMELVMEQLTWLAEALIEAALQAALALASEQRPLPSRIDPARLACVVLGLGRLGGGEMDYASPLELIVAYDANLADGADRRTTAEHFERVAKMLARLLSSDGQSQCAFAVSLPALPDSTSPALAHAADDVAFGFESFGRTWHRQQMLRARPIAGDLELGQALLGKLEAWLFRRYLNPADETGIRAWRRRIQVAAKLSQEEWRSVREARGGVRDVEATVQLLQLLMGGEFAGVRGRSILPAIAALEAAELLAVEERMTLEANYIALRRLEHGLQIRGHGADRPSLPQDEQELTSLIRSLGFSGTTEEYCSGLRERFIRTWQILDRLLSSAFAEEPPCPREVDLLLDPDPSDEETRAALAPFGFAHPNAALVTLQRLAEEQVPFLSTRRCRHLLSQILPQLLCAVAAAPNPDATLDQLLAVSNSLGGKGALWELFAAHPPSLQLYVRLCAASPYLSGILTTNPGMMDELVDSLQLQHLPTRDELQRALDDLCQGAADTLPILHDFKNAHHLRIGVRDMLGKEDIDQTHQALAAVAETCLGHVARLEYQRLVEKYGVPTIGPGPFEGETCRLVIVGLGRLGGREPNYHSDLEVMFLYEADGLTRPASRRHQPTANNHFFTQLAQGILKQIAQLTEKGRLYPIEAALRPIGVGGSLALSLADFAQHFTGGAAPLWQWLALCKACPVFGEPTAAAAVENLIHQLLTSRVWSPSDRHAGYQLRLRQERGASPHNLKRGLGGTADVETIVQLLQLEYAAHASHHAPRDDSGGAAAGSLPSPLAGEGPGVRGPRPNVLTTNTQEALDRLAAAGALPKNLAAQLGDSFRFLRRVESGLRLLETKARHDLPASGEPLHQLALLIGHSNPTKLREQCLAYMAQNRAVLEQLAGPQR